MASPRRATWPTVLIPAFVEFRGGHVADAPQSFDRERVEERKFTVRRHDEHAFGLGHAARHLREELRPRYADGDRQADAFEHGIPQPDGDLGRRARDPLEAANVEERLVDREALDERRRVVEDLVHRLACLRVGRHSRPDDDRVRAQAARPRSAHRRADAEGLRLVAGREHDTGADDHGPAAEMRIVPLLDGRVERVEVGVEDRRVAHDEHMFARRG